MPNLKEYSSEKKKRKSFHDNKMSQPTVVVILSIFCLGFRKNAQDHDVTVAKENITNFEVGVSRGTFLDLFIHNYHKSS